LLVRADGTVLSWGRAQQVGLSGRSLPVTVQAANRALGGVDCNDLHIVGSGQLTEPPETMGFAVKKDCRLRLELTTEEIGPLALVDQECGVVIVAGTGARVSGRNREGRFLTADGMGPVLGDAGSGYQIGYQGMRAAVKGVWHPRHATTLTEKIFDACCQTLDAPPAKTAAAVNQAVTGKMARAMALRAIREKIHPQAPRLTPMIEFSLRPQDRSVIASLARIVDAEARAGDAVAVGILETAAAEMAETVRDVVDHLGMGRERYVVVGTGSVATRSDIYWQRLHREIRAINPLLEPVRIPYPPVVGIALATLQDRAGADRVGVTRRFYETLERIRSQMENDQ
jgi:hypothetical protein